MINMNLNLLNMKPKILNKVKNEKYVMILYTFGSGKEVTFFDIFTNNYTDEHNEILTETLNSIKSSGIEVIETKDNKVNFPEGKKFNICIKFVLWNKDVRKVYDKIKSLFEYEY